MKQRGLFEGRPQLPEGFLYRLDFITRDEEAAFLAEIARLPLSQARYREFTARRRIMSYGGSYDFSKNRLNPAEPIPTFLHPLREKLAQWAGVPAEDFIYALIAEYGVGAPLGWHRDLSEFELVAGVSLLGPGRMRLRPYPPRKGRNPDAFSLELAPRSAYIMSGEARWGWQHSVPPAKVERYSVTFRTQRSGGTAPAGDNL